MLMRHYVIFWSACRIQTASRPVSCTGSWDRVANLSSSIKVRPCPKKSQIAVLRHMHIKHIKLNTK